jgi:hypothetical protein
MPRRRTLVCLALAIAATGVGIYLCLPRGPRFTNEMFERIQTGMTQGEVEAILKCPPGDYTSAKLLPLTAECWLSRQDLSGDDRSSEWAADMPESAFEYEFSPSQRLSLAIRVWFNPDGKATGKERLDITHRQSSLLERLRAWVAW